MTIKYVTPPTSHKIHKISIFLLVLVYIYIRCTLLLFETKNDLFILFKGFEKKSTNRFKGIYYKTKILLYIFIYMSSVKFSSVQLCFFFVDEQ